MYIPYHSPKNRTLCGVAALQAAGACGWLWPAALALVILGAPGSQWRNVFRQRKRLRIFSNPFEPGESFS
jgi:hypothetical protein